jgi:hypothetical protein
MKIQHSPQRTQHVVGAVSRHHDLPRQQLESIVADALEAALIFDHDNRSGSRVDSIRTDASDKRPQPADRDQVHEISRAQRDAAAADMKNQWRKENRTGNAGSR